MEKVTATRYVTPLREGGSLPGLMEADDLGTYVVKFTGAGQGPAALVAEVICAGLARALGLPVPRLVGVELAAGIARGEPDEEIQALLRASVGVNLGVDFLPGALDVGPNPTVDSELAGRVVWFDAMVNNVDRSWRNANLLRWHRQLYLIDHGAALTYQHSWPAGDPDGDRARAHRERFAAAGYRVGDHVLLASAPDVAGADAAVTRESIRDGLAGAVAEVPVMWLAEDPDAAAMMRDRHVSYLLARYDARSEWLPELVEHAAAGVQRDAKGERVPSHRTAGRPDWLPQLPGTSR
jgi:hypothetical protein